MAYNSKVLEGTKIFQAGAECWKQSEALHLPSEGAIASWICRDAIAPLLVLFPDTRRVRDFVCDARELGISQQAEFLPEFFLGNDEAQCKAVNAKRGAIMSRFKSGALQLLAATPASVCAPFVLGGDNFKIKVGEETGRQRLIMWLESKGYEKCDLVWSPGQFAVRGSVVDVFSPSEVWPLRIEFFDDEIESMRLFATDTQKSLRITNNVSLQGLNGSAEAKLKELLPEAVRIIYFDPFGLDNAAENSEWLRDNLAFEAGIDVSDWPHWQEVRLFFAKFPQLRVVKDIEKSSLRFDLAGFPYFRGRNTKLNAYCRGLAAEGFEVIVYSEIAANLAWAKECGYAVHEGMLCGGFIDRIEKKAFITDLELSGISLSARNAERFAPSEWGESFMRGQWVVHEDYGLCRYEGTELVESSSGLQEYIALNFAQEQRLLVPLMQFYKISPYAVMPGEEPVADSLRGVRWKKSTQKAREAAAEAARELAEVYAKRELTEGYAFNDHSELMKELEDGFGYTETSDQLKAIDAVLKDMQSSMPMDRLLVGDVGFGKTEVALRAVGEAVFDGKQVALLVPTTLLANQHYDTFVTRFASLPVRVEMLSRFVSSARQKKILHDLSLGKVDVLVGTHRLLSEDVRFSNLGLVVVDEEHRFGVMHKEKLKKLTPEVDVLMLSATPIPRSLSLSLSGLRDMSLLETPPLKRRPVITVVRRWSEELLKNAVFHEKARGGQVFFIHNRIRDIQDRAVLLRRLFPKLNIAVAHSRTPESELERVMREFTDGVIDILLCTTIVESGLDIPCANTLIVDDAHELGLAQMYQLRGRVGRREEQAYAYLFYPKGTTLTREAEERLDAIAELDELGAGYRLAQTDLQIRGGGDLVGIAQHGHSSKIGYRQYCDILSEEIAKLKGEEKYYADVQVGFPLTIPPHYLPQENLRVAFYRRMLRLSSLAEERELRTETHDRFGKLPEGVDMLLKLNAVRAELAMLGAQRIEIDRQECRIFGDTAYIKKNLKLPRGWFLKADGTIIGHGGFRGIDEIYMVIANREQASKQSV